MSKSRVSPNSNSGIFLSVLVGLIASASMPLAVAQDSEESEAIDEVVVYSNKRGAVALQDIATSIGVLVSEDLEKMGAINFDDISRTIVGLDVVNQGVGKNMVVIRGINPEGESGATILWDNIRTSGAGEAGSDVGQRQFDLDVYDIQQVEVLRGPQGTLYGANSLAGVVRFITNKPVMGEVSAELIASVNDVAHSEDIGWSQKGFINFPIFDEKVNVCALSNSCVSVRPIMVKSRNAVSCVVFSVW